MNNPILQQYLPYIALASVALSIICLVIAIVAISTNRRMKRRLQQWKDIGSASDLEAVFEHTKNAVMAIRGQVTEMESDMERVKEEMSGKVSTPAMQRYNAFSEVGSDLSYSVALLDDRGDGVVLTSIYGRDDSVTYGKPIHRGDSDYLLTNEEQTVIRTTLHKNQEKAAVKTV